MPVEEHRPIVAAPYPIVNTCHGLVISGDCCTLAQRGDVYSGSHAAGRSDPSTTRE